MAKSSQKYTESTKESFQDDYEDFGYQVQNQKRYSSRKKQQSKFKDYDEYSDWEWYHYELNTLPHPTSSRGGTQALPEGSGGVYSLEVNTTQPWKTTATASTLPTTGWQTLPSNASSERWCNVSAGRHPMGVWPRAQVDSGESGTFPTETDPSALYWHQFTQHHEQHHHQLSWRSNGHCWRAMCIQGDVTLLPQIHVSGWCWGHAES